MLSNRGRASQVQEGSSVRKQQGWASEHGGGVHAMSVPWRRHCVRVVLCATLRSGAQVFCEKYHVSFMYVVVRFLGNFQATVSRVMFSELLSFPFSAVFGVHLGAYASTQGPSAPTSAPPPLLFFQGPQCTESSPSYS